MKVPGPLCLHLLYLVFQYTLDFITHGFSAALAEMDAHHVGGSSDFLYQRGGVLRHTGRGGFFNSDSFRLVVIIMGLRLR